jgi:signal peptidase II
MKGKQLAFIISGIIIIDQVLKFYIKTHYFLHENHAVLGSNGVVPNFSLYFVENEGMAWGWKFGGDIGKIILTLFRLCAVIWGVFLLKGFIEKKYHKGFIICAGMIFAGALGNLIDSMFYGMIFENSSDCFPNIAHLFPKGGGYASFLHGKVVDMLYFPIVKIEHLPAWIPFFGGGEFTFFDPIFNFADASISVGVMAILLFQKTFFKIEGSTTPDSAMIPEQTA